MPELANTPGSNLSRFDRQRRNLTITWAVLFFFQTVEPQIERVNLSPVQVGVVIPKEMLLMWICGLLIYFLIRYNQFFNTVLNVNLDFIATKDEMSRRIIHKRLEPLIREQLDEDWKDAKMYFEPTAVMKSGTTFYQTNNITVEKTGSVATRNINTVSLPLTAWERWWATQQAMLVTSWRSHSFSEYYLPFVLPYISIVWEIGKIVTK